LRITIGDPTAVVVAPKTSPWDEAGKDNKLTKNAGTYGAGYFTTLPSTSYNDLIKTIVVSPDTNIWGTGICTFNLSPATTSGMVGIPVFSAATLKLVNGFGNLPLKKLAATPKAWIWTNIPGVSVAEK
jgi:hypothetical protein